MGGWGILLHVKRKWSKGISTVLWIYTVQAIVEQHNCIALDKEGRSPFEKYIGKMDDKSPTNFHTWGCPVIILDVENQSGAIDTPKWEPQLYTEIYLGHSRCQTGFVSLVLNLQTGMVSTQFYVVYDDEITTVPYIFMDKTTLNWLDLLRQSTERSTEDQSKLLYHWLHPSTTKDNVTSAHNGISPSSLLVTDDPPETDTASELHQNVGGVIFFQALF